MTVAEMIKKTRLDHHMTQEEYGDTFGVTRQTVSSWENEKSMPDLQMLITICNTYKISLDALLNDDNEYVNKIDIMQKMGRILQRVWPVLCMIACAFLLLFGVWKVTEKKENEGFEARVKELGFVSEEGPYIMRDADIVYELPNQKLPFMKFKFHAQSIHAIYKTEDYHCRIVLSYDGEQTYSFSIDYGMDTSITGVMTADEVIEYAKLSKADTELLDACGKDLEEILFTMIDYYNVAYDLGESL